MADEMRVPLLLPDEIAAMRVDEEHHGLTAAAFALNTRDANYQDRWCPIRIIHTLEAQAADLKQCLEIAGRNVREADRLKRELIEAAGERDAWKAEAEDQRAAVARLQTETDVLRAKLRHAYGIIEDKVLGERARKAPRAGQRERDGGTGLPGESVGGD